MNKTEAKKILSLYKNLSFFDRFHIYIRLRRLPFETIEKYIPKNGKILDFGCGHGFFSLYMSQKSPARNIIGVDISKEKINVAKASKHSNKVSFSYDLRSMSFLEKQLDYDCIVIINVLYLLRRKEQEKVLEKASKALVKNGKLLIVEPDANLKFRTFYEIIRESIMLKLLRRTQGKGLTFNTKEWWIENLKKYLKKVEVREFPNKKHHLLYICTK
ncbi:MAG: class I SAM-dependent methyltransferase [Candidatus Levybacteria bacterium]|nr:class I SAM-dependent methyltransferase [Candidatus Levybacteria bacterium]